MPIGTPTLRKYSCRVSHSLVFLMVQEGRAIVGRTPNCQGHLSSETQLLKYLIWSGNYGKDLMLAVSVQRWAKGLSRQTTTNTPSMDC